MALLVLNLGSSSLKAAVFDAAGEQRLWSDSRSGLELTAALDTWLKPALAPWWGQLERAGHRVVHGGEVFREPTPINAATLAQLEALSPLAPLHNPPALEAMRWLQQQQPLLPQWACFDTAFHATLPEAAYSYAIPLALRSRGYRRFGFHGINHQSGLAGLSGLSGDWQELRGAAERGHTGAQLALAVFLRRLRAGIAAMAASLGGVDQIALSGGIGANDTALAQQLQTELAWLGKPHWLQIPADEEGMIARLISEDRR